MSTTQFVWFPPNANSDFGVKTNAVFVSASGGSDVDGSGTMAAPFATYTHALSTITTASGLNPFVIVILPGVYSEATFVLKPFISVMGTQTTSSVVNVSSNQVTLDSSWNGASSSITVSQLTFSGSTALVLNATGFSGASTLYFRDLKVASASTFKASSSGTFGFVTYDCIFITSLTVDSVRGYTDFGSSIVSFTVLDTNQQCLPLSFSSSISTLAVTSTGSGCIFYGYSGQQLGSITGTGSGAQINVDSSLWVSPTLNSGATLTLLTKSDAISADYSPVNYTAVNSAVQGHLHGIDNALGGLGGNTVNFSVIQTPQQTIPNNSTTKVNFQSKNFDTGNYFNTSTATYTPLVAGEYLFSFQGGWAAPSVANAVVQFFIYKNGTPVAQTLSYTIGMGLLANIPPLTTILSMNGTTDNVQIFANITGNGGSGLSVANGSSNFYFCGALLDQKGSALTPAIETRTIYYSLEGSDIDGDGSQAYPYLTPNNALIFGLLTFGNPTLANPFTIVGDAGTYSIATSGALVYPNVNWKGNNDVIWTSGGSITSITLFTSAPGFGSPSTTGFFGITLDSTLTLNLDTTGITNFNCTHNYEDFTAQANTTFKAGSSSHVIIHNLNGNVNLATANTKTFTYDGVQVNANGPHTLGFLGSIVCLGTNQQSTLQSIGNTGLGPLSITANNIHNVAFFAFAGYPIEIPSTINAAGTAGLQIQLDSTTLIQELFINLTGSNYSFVNVSLQNWYVATALTDGATVTWDGMIAPTASWVITASGHTLSNPINLTPGYLYYLTIQQDGTGGRIPSFGTNFVFPQGQPYVNTAANAYTNYQFYCTNGFQMVCINSRLLETSTITAAGVGAGANLILGSTNNATVYGEAAGAALPSAPANASKSTLIGYQAGTAITTSGSANDGHVAVGYQSLATTTTSAGNTAIGFQALQLLTSSPSNVAVGWGAGVQLTSGSGQNVLVGLFAGSGGVGQTIANNVFIGYHSGWNTSTAGSNVLLGGATAPTLTTGSNNVVIGQAADVSAANAQNQIVIGQGISGLGNNIAVIGNSSTSNLVNAGTTGNCALGSSANPFGFLYLGSASNYLAIDTGTQTTSGQTIVFPDAGGQPQSISLYSITAVTGTSQTMVKWFKYFANNASLVTFTLPATIAQGDVFEVIGQGAGGWKIAYGTGVSIKLTGNLSTTTTSGSLSSTDQYDAVRLIAESSTVLVVEHVKGNLVTDTGAVFNAINTNSPYTLVTVSGTSKTLALSDAGTFQVCSNASTQTITVPTNASVAFSTGTKIEFMQQGAGKVTLAAAGGVTIQSKASNLSIAAQYSGATLTFLGSNTWSLIGDLTV